MRSKYSAPKYSSKCTATARPNPLPPPPTGGFPDPQPVPGEIVRDAEGHPTFPGTAETWFSMLDRGLRPTGMGNSNSHGILFDGEPGYARTIVGSSARARTPSAMFSQDDVVAAIKGSITPSPPMRR